jgi:hypothetical protein
MYSSCTGNAPCLNEHAEQRSWLAFLHMKLHERILPRVALESYARSSLMRSLVRVLKQMLARCTHSIGIARRISGSHFRQRTFGTRLLTL